MKNVDSGATPSNTETWEEIAGLVDELAEIASSDVAPQRFHEELLDRAVRASASIAGVLWLRNTPQSCRIECQIHFDQVLARRVGSSARNVTHDERQASAEGNDREASISAQHQSLANGVIDRGEGTLISPRSSSAGETESSCDCVVILHPIAVEGEAIGALELLQEADTSPSAQRGVQQLLSVLCGLAADYHRIRILRKLREKDRSRQALDQFVHGMLEHLQGDSLAYFIANEGRRIIECDRLSVLTCRGASCRVSSISGVDTIDRRSTTVRALEAAASHVLVDGRPRWLDRELPAGAAVTASGSARRDVSVLAANSGETPVSRNVSSLDPDPVSDYLQENSAIFLGFFPVRPKSGMPVEPQASAAIAMLVVECFGRALPLQTITERTDWVAQHCAPALDHVSRVADQPLMWLSSRLALLSRGGLSRRKPLALYGFLALLGLGFLLAFLPADFHVEARGELQPGEQEFIFAPRDGVVIGLPAFPEGDRRTRKDDAIEIEKDQPVVELENADLEYELTTVLGEQATALRQLDTISITLEQLGRAATSTDQHRFDELTAQKLELETALKSLSKRLEILQREQQQLVVRASIAGQVQTWDVVAQLKSRPVRQGQRLLTIANVKGPWRLEVRVPDHHIGYINAARGEGENGLPVTFLLKSDPARVYRGRVDRVAMSTEVIEDYGLSVLLTVAIDDPTQFHGVRPGTSVIAKIHCGRKSLGYVWLHDLIETARRSLLF